MAVSFDFYSDAALTSVLAELTSTHLATAVGGGPVDHKVYFGSATASRKAQADSQPGVDLITISILDSAAASGESVNAVKLATTQVGLDTATAGAALSLAATINSGSVNAVEVWLRVHDETAVVGEYTDLSLQTNTLRETAV